MHRLQELVRLHRMGTGARRIAKLLGMSPNTERSYRMALDAASLLVGPVDELPELGVLREAVAKQRPPPEAPKQEVSSIAEYAKQIEELLGKGLTARPIYDRLRLEDDGFEGSYWAVKRMCRKLRRARGVRAEDVAIPVETEPGEVAQVDFGYVGKLLCPEQHVPRRAWVFVMTLAYSRHMYAEIVFDQKTTTWLALHKRAFEAFGGVPEVVVPDNLKAAVVRAAFAVDGDSELNRSYRELARHYRVKIDPAPPRAPKKKGKVESSVKYVKRNALLGREGESIQDANRALKQWVENIAGTRTHGTTGMRPLDIFRGEEHPKLQELPEKPYEMVIWRKAKVHQDTHISFEKRLYSVPWRWIGTEVWVQATSSTIAIFAEDVRVATHDRNGKKTRSTVESHLPEHRRDRRHRSRTYWEKRAAGIGPETAGLAREVFESDDVLSQLRKVQAIVTYLETFPAERAEATSRRARFFGTYSYKGVKSILARALDLEPLPQAVLPCGDPAKPPRFARSVKELLAARLEVHDEPH